MYSPDTASWGRCGGSQLFDIVDLAAPSPWFIRPCARGLIRFTFVDADQLIWNPQEEDVAGLPLEGVKVLDHGIVYTGTAATTLLADMGAEVIRIESIQVLQPFTRGMVTRPPRREEPTPGYVNGDPGERPWERWFQLHAIQRNKYGITLDLTRTEGVEIYKRLVKRSDVVLENFAPGVMDRLGLGYETLKEVKGDIIMISASGLGAAGHYAGFSAVGTSLDGMTGMASLRGYPGDDLLMRTPLPVWSDNVAAGTAVFAALAALHFRRKTGKGQFIDLSQAETFLPHMGESIMEYTMNKKVRKAVGNQAPGMAPYGCYRCSGEDKWATIAVCTEKQWEALCRVLGNPSWADDPRFATALSRWENREQLDGFIEQSTLQRNPYEVMHALQEQDVPAGVVARPSELYADPHLRERGFFHEVTHSEAGTHLYPGMCFRFSGTPVGFRMPPNLLGEHNDYVYGEVLGLTEEEIALLKQKAVIGDTFLPEI